MNADVVGLGYGLVVAVHVAAAMVWVGGDLTIQLLIARARRRRDDGSLLTAVRDSEWVGTRVLSVASGTVLGSAVALLAMGPHGLNEWWVRLGLAGYLTAALLGALVQGLKAQEWPACC